MLQPGGQRRRTGGRAHWQQPPGERARELAAARQVPGQPVDAGLEAGDALEVGLVLVGKDHPHVLGVAAAGRAVEGVHQPPVVQQHLARGLADRPVAQRVLDLHAAVDLAAGRGADVVALAGELAQVAQGVGARRHRLGLERLQVVEHLGPHLARHDAAQVVLEVDLVDQVERAAAVEVDQDAAAVAAARHP